MDTNRESQIKLSIYDSWVAEIGDLQLPFREVKPGRRRRKPVKPKEVISVNDVT